jgi:hypothetical protein
MTVRYFKCMNFGYFKKRGAELVSKWDTIYKSG